MKQKFIYYFRKCYLNIIVNITLMNQQTTFIKKYKPYYS